MTKLKRCPFCGDCAKVVMTNDSVFPSAVRCCNADCACRTTEWITTEMAVAAWNRRVKPKPDRATQKKLKALKVFEGDLARRSSFNGKKVKP